MGCSYTLRYERKMNSARRNEFYVFGGKELHGGYDSTPDIPGFNSVSSDIGVTVTVSILISEPEMI